jgi:spore maturation protein CgeB
LKVLYACWLDPATTDVPLFMARAWQADGHEVRLFPFDLEYSNGIPASLVDTLSREDAGLRESILEARIHRACKDFQPDVLLFGHPFIPVEALMRLRSRHGCLLGYFIGYNNLLEHGVVATISAADFVIVHDSYLLPLIEGSRFNRKENVLFLKFWATPDEHRPVPLSDEDRADYAAEVAFIGGSGPNRVQALGRLRQYDLRIWGVLSDWKRYPDLAHCIQEEPVYGLKKVKIYHGSKIVLNIEDDEKQVNALSNRIPEVLACGGFVLTEWRKDLDRCDLVDGESIAVYRSIGEMEEKVAHYLASPEERNRIGANGREVVLNSLTNHHVLPPLGRQMEALCEKRKRRSA